MAVATIGDALPDGQPTKIGSRRRLIRGLSVMSTHTCGFLVATVLLATASDADDWHGLVKTYIEAYESIKDPVPTAYPQLAKRLRSLFGVQGVGHIQIVQEEDGKRKVYSDVYYRVGEVHIAQHVEGWNLVTKGTEAYEWEVGKNEGVITKLANKDLIDYLLYVTDPSYIMTSMYHDGFYAPEKFLPPKQVEHGCKEMRLRKPIEGFRAVFVADEPFWFCGFEVGDPKGDKSSRVFYSKPESLKDVPAEVLHRLKGIEFKKSNLSIRRHMVFL
jgi:hypothetical protein